MKAALPKFIRWQGWTRERQIERLRELAERCERVNPDQAAFLRQWAEHLERNP